MLLHQGNQEQLHLRSMQVLLAHGLVLLQYLSQQEQVKLLAKDGAALSEQVNAIFFPINSIREVIL